jgi:hypothetical protein
MFCCGGGLEVWDSVQGCERFCCCVALLVVLCLEIEVDMDVLNNTDSPICNLKFENRAELRRGTGYQIVFAIQKSDHETSPSNN